MFNIKRTKHACQKMILNMKMALRNTSLVVAFKPLSLLEQLTGHHFSALRLCLRVVNMCPGIRHKL